MIFYLFCWSEICDSKSNHERWKRDDMTRSINMSAFILVISFLCKIDMIQTMLEGGGGDEVSRSINKGLKVQTMNKGKGTK